jgi:sRNA-binding carbon storage regulator CsrA
LISSDIVICIAKISGGQVRLRISAPKNIPIYPEKYLTKIQKLVHKKTTEPTKKRAVE